MLAARAPTNYITDSSLSPRIDDRTLRFTQDDTFQISVFEDLHFAEDATRDSMTKDVMRYVMTEEVAQLFVLNGDLISGEVTRQLDSSRYLHEVASPLVDADRVWASTYGNHDSDVNLNPMKDIFEQERRYPNSLTRNMVSTPDAGITNYYLLVYPPEASASAPTLILWFFDSRGGHYPTDQAPHSGGATRPDWVDESVVEWFMKTNNNLTAQFGQVIPSLAFYHIPAHAMLEYQDEAIDLHMNPGINGETVVPQGSGETEYTGQDSRFMQALLNTPGLMATFSGHDHENDWCFKWNHRLVDQHLAGNGINMCYGRHTGYGGYGDATRGARQILLDLRNLKNQVHTWVRLEDGTISAPATLNTTYGHAIYGEVSHRVAQVSGAEHMYDQSYLLLLVCLWLPILSFWCRRRH